MGIVAVVVLAVVGGILVAANGGEDGDTAGGSPSSSTTEGNEPLTIEREIVPPTTRADEPSTTQEGPPATGRPPVIDQVFLGEPLAGGVQAVTARLDGYNRISHVVEVPAGATATVTVTPLADDLDIELVRGSEEINIRQIGDPETVTIEGPTSEPVEVDSFFGNAGPYEITVAVS